MDCRILLFSLMALSLASAMTFELGETTPGTVHYRIVERGASNSTVYIIAMLGEEQYSVSTVHGFNGIAEGELFLMEQGVYTVTANNLDTGAQATTTIQIPSALAISQVRESSEQLSGDIVEAQQTIPMGDEASILVIALAAGVLLLIAAILLFGNPFTHKRAGGKEAGGKEAGGKAK